MAFGRPIVAFDLLEHRRSAEDAAVYVAPNDHVAFARAIRDLLVHPELRERMSHIARTRFHGELAWEKGEEQLLSMYRELLREARNTKYTASAGAVSQ
jgi:glycosyltransferase involved in cell wall biosynthesis